MAKKKEPNGTAKTTDATEGLPLFFKTPRAVDITRHADAGVNPNAGYGFAKPCNSIPINVIEFVEASRYYPIVFTQGEEVSPAVVVGFEQENYCITSKGEWLKDAYIPAYVRQYPFVFFDAREQEKLVLCIDESAPHFEAKSSKPEQTLFTDGAPSLLAKNALQFCSNMHAHFKISREFCTDLVKHKLLAPNGSEVTLNSGRKMQLGGFQLIDETALNTLSDEVFLEFRKKGWLPFIYLALSSMGNWRKLVDLAGAREAAAAA